MSDDAERYRRLAEDCRKQASYERDQSEQARLLKTARIFDNFSAQALQRSAAGRQQKTGPRAGSNAPGAKTRR
jgi:hypothetical protein